MTALQRLRGRSMVRSSPAARTWVPASPVKTTHDRERTTEHPVEILDAE